VRFEQASGLVPMSPKTTPNAPNVRLKTEAGTCAVSAFGRAVAIGTAAGRSIARRWCASAAHDAQPRRLESHVLLRATHAFDHDANGCARG
jgi:hypothetical protein